MHQIRAEFDCSILLVEHHMNLVMRVSTRSWRWRAAARSPTAPQAPFATTRR